MNGFIELLGIDCVSINKDIAIGEIVLSKNHMNPYGIVHGGTIFSLADTISGMAVIQSGRYCTTVNGSIEYIKAAKDCKKIICESKVIHSGKTLAFSECDIKNENGVLLAKGKFIYCYI